MQIQCPSKTFIVGEYAVLHGGAGIVLVHTPYFIATRTKAPPFHPESPAGVYLSKNAPHSVGQIAFVDPHERRGGFGGSSAEFLAAYCLVNELTLPLSKQDAFLAWASYLDILGATKASGVDVLSQTQAPGIYYIHPANQEITPLPWLFPGHQLEVEHTGIKTATHIHLASAPVVIAEPLNEIVAATKQALETADLPGLIAAINAYQAELHRQNLTHPKSLQLQAQRKHDPTILSQKGCGALGSDVLLTLRRFKPI